MKKTSANYDKSKYILLAIILYIVIIIIDILCIKGIFKILNTSNGELLINMRIIPLCMVSIILTISISYFWHNILYKSQLKVYFINYLLKKKVLKMIFI